MGIVYRHVSPSGKSYVGQTKHDQWERRCGSDPLIAYENSTKFLNAIRKYGWENFSHEILESNLNSVEERNFSEIKWIESLDSIMNGYNQRSGGHHNIESFANRTFIALEAKLICEKYNQGFSLAEIAKEFKCSRTGIRTLLKRNDIPLRGCGEMPKSFAYKTFDKRNCLVCGEEFRPKKEEVKTCSAKCRSFLGRANQLEKTVDEIKETRVRKNEVHISETGSRAGGKISSHNRWHLKKNVFNPNCEICLIDL